MRFLSKQPAAPSRGCRNCSGSQDVKQFEKRKQFSLRGTEILRKMHTWSASNVDVLLKVSLRKTQEGSFSGKWQKGYSAYTDILTVEYYWFNYHELRMTILERASWVAISIFLAVNNSTLHCFLNLKYHINRGQNLPEITHFNFSEDFISPFGQKIQLVIGTVLPIIAHLSAQDAVHHHNDKALEGIKDGEEDLEESWAAVSYGQHCRHPGEC